MLFETVYKTLSYKSGTWFSQGLSFFICALERKIILPHFVFNWFPNLLETMFQTFCNRNPYFSARSLFIIIIIIVFFFSF